MDNSNIPPTEQELRDLGSAEFNAMTFTPPGGEAMTLDEYTEHFAQTEQKRQASLTALQQHNADEARRRRAMEHMTHEQRVVYIAQENAKIDQEEAETLSLEESG